MNAFLHWLWITNLAGSAAIVLTLLLVPPLRKWLGAQAAFSAWAFSLVILASPWLVRSPVSILPPASALPPVVVQVVVPAQFAASTKESPASRHANFPWAFAIWAAGTSAFLFVALLRTLRTRRLAGRSVNITPQLQKPLDDLGGLPPRAQVRESLDIRSPAMCGVLRPVILLPAGWAKQTPENDLRWILLHEIGHIRRGDLLWRWAFQILRAIHWFNPLVWLAERAARVDQEMACDEWVLAHGDMEEGTAYGEAILRAARPAAGSWFMQAGMAESKAGLSRRIRHLATAHPRGLWALAVTLILGCVALLLFSPGSAAQPAKTVFSRPEPAAAPFKQVEIESKFLEMSPEAAEKIFGEENPDRQTILQEEDYQKLIRRLGQQEGVDLISAPKVTTKFGQRATIQIIREFPYPSKFNPPDQTSDRPTPTSFETRNLGITLETESTLTADDRIICWLSPRVVEFLGFVNYGAERPAPHSAEDDAIEAALRPAASAGSAINQPIFRTREMQTTVVLRSNQTVLLGGLSRKTMQAAENISDFRALQAITAPSSKPGAKAVERVLYIFVTPRLMNAEGLPISADSTAPARREQPQQAGVLPSPVPESNGSPPYGVAVPGKPGFATSPHAPQAGYVDLRGYPPGTEVKCPYTGKPFLVP